MYPAAFSTPWQGGPPWKGVPVTSVGALNPNRSVAMFSNAGKWIMCHRPGAALMSCYPCIDGSEQSSYKLWVPEEGWRETVDPDDFSSGFAVWSGTSFAAPLFAGEVAQYLFENGTDRCPQDKAVERCDAAVEACRLKPVKKPMEES